jgi:nitrogen regulatory protein P-II 1
MKKIEALIKPFKLEEVRDALSSLGINGMTISEVGGCGRRNGPFDFHRGRECAPDFQPKIKLEVVVADALSGPVSAAIVDAARTGSIDDGNIFISQVDEAIRIRTHETDQMAVC